METDTNEEQVIVFSEADMTRIKQTIAYACAVEEALVHYRLLGYHRSSEVESNYRDLAIQLATDYHRSLLPSLD